MCRISKGFKSEWATVKDQTLYVGSMGKEWTTEDGLFQNYNPMFVKAVTTKGEVCNNFFFVFHLLTSSFTFVYLYRLFCYLPYSFIFSTNLFFDFIFLCICY